MRRETESVSRANFREHHKPLFALLQKSEVGLCHCAKALSSNENLWQNSLRPPMGNAQIDCVSVARHESCELCAIQKVRRLDLGPDD